MIRLKKLTALLVSAALALSLLAGCGGSKALSQVIADLLSGQYNNVTVEVDPDLTAALKKAAAAGDTQEEVLAALVENLNLSGGSITFNNLGDGQQGQHGVTLTFQPGSDPDAAARSAFTEWNRVFSSLPDDGSYRAHVSMIEAEGGYYIAVDVEVLKAGSHDKDEPEPDYTYDKSSNTYTVYTAAGLRAWAEAAKVDSSTNCTLTANIDLAGQPWTPVGDYNDPYTGTFDGGDCTIFGLSVSSSAQYAGLFGCVGDGGTVKNLTLDSPTVNSSSTTDAGAVAGYNNGGAIENCHVTGSGTITGNNAGGVVGYNSAGTITGCSSTVDVTGTGSAPYTGGVVGINCGGTVTACSSTGDVTATGDSTIAGGVVGDNYSNGEVIACYATGNVTANGSDTYAGGVVGVNESSGTVTACCSTSSVSGYKAGGVVGSNSGTVTACYATGDVTGNTYAGGVVGYNNGTVTACYWSGSVADDKGIGNDDPTGEATKVDGSTTWETAATAMNNAIAEWNQSATVKCNYSYDTSSPPKLKAGAPSSTTP